jgi:PRC-barrel domain
MTRTLVVAAVSGLMIATALAQSPAPAPAPPSAAGTGPSTSQIVATQARDEWLASSMTGTLVVGADLKKLGEVADILIDRTCQVHAFLVGVDGKKVAIEMTEFDEMPTPDGKVQLKLDMTKEQLAAAPAFKSLMDSATTGAAAGGAPR